MRSRFKLSIYNAALAVISNLLSVVLSFISRTLFIKFLGATLLGVDGLFTNILSILSFTELGIGTAMNFYLYKPIAEDDKDKICALMRFYQIAYRVIGCVIITLGLLIFPFLDIFVKNDAHIDNLHIYYLIFLFNTSISYFASYRNAIVNGMQQGYVLTRINIVFNVCRVLLQIIGLVVTKNYFVYILTNLVTEVSRMIYTYWYIGKRYPSYCAKAQKTLPKEDVKSIWHDVRALIMHKIGEMSVHQTDNILISMFVNVATVGLISNYNMVIVTVTTIINLIINAAVPSLGNYMALENKDSSYGIFKAYRFIAYGLYGFSTLAFFFLLTPFITLWIGKDYIVDMRVIALILLNFYMTGHRVALLNMKIATGIFDKDKYISVLQGTINLVVSIYFAHRMGLVGIYIGTIAQGAFSSVVRPFMLYPMMFNRNGWAYFADSVKYLFQIFLIGSVLFLLQGIIMPEVTILSFTIFTVTVGVVGVSMFALLNCRSKEFKYILGRIKNWRN